MTKPTTNPKSKSPEIEPEQSPFLGDLTPEFIRWHQATKTPQEHYARYYDRIPHEYNERFGIDRV